MAKTQQQVIKDFMSALVNNETLDLDEAVYVACSEVPESKKFKTMNDATKRFIDDCNNFMEPYKDYAASHYHKDTDYNNYLNKKAKEFLITYCGIDLDNEDTGAITGKDAGGSTIEKTAESIVPETDSSDEPNFVDVIINTSTGEHEPIQSLNFTRNGLEILVYDSLSSDEKKVVRGLYKWWIEEGLNLIKESYDISFNEERSFNEESVSFHKLRIIFYDNESSSVLASTGGNGEPWSLSRLDHAFIGYRDLNINIAHYKNLISSNENGTNGSVGKYLDRTIAHELTHAVMSANINDYDDLPEFIVEGMAELTHGVDDVRGDNILKLALGAVDSLGDMRLEKALNPNNIAVDSNDYYAGGYMFLRYFAKQISEVLLDTSEPEPEPETSSSAVEVMHNFLDSLNNTYLRGNAAVNEAIQSSSNFTDLEDLINKFIADFNQSSSGDDFLKTYCGINLDNEDTGAITGKDAGGSVVKTKESVVPELGSTTSSYPDSNSIYYRGLTINFPSRYSLNETQQNIIAGINTWWLKSALDLAEETYGLSFNDSGVTFNTLDISFDVSEAPERDSYFMFWSNDWTGKVSRMTLHINSDHYTSLTTTDTNGTNTSSVSNKYLDEVIASLINNALIAANVNYSWKLPSFVDYGLDFLMTGADNGTKTRTAIIDLASDADKLIEFTLNNNRTAVGLRDTDTYDSAAGYMLMRYLAKNAHRTYDSTVSKGTKEADIINIMNDDYVIRTYSGDDVIYSWDSASIIYAGEGNDTIKNYNSDYYDTGKTSDNKNSILHGGAGNDYILNANRDSTINGGTGNDVIELADESTNAVIRYASGDGNDTIYGFTAADMLQIISSDYIIETRDENVIISVPSDDDSGTITVVDGAYTDLNIVTVKGDTIFDDDTIPEDDTTSDGNDDYTINKAMTAVTLGSGFKGTFDLADLAKVKTVVGSQVSNDVEIIGNDKVNKLIGGSGKDTLNGGTGKDTLTGNSGADVFVYESGSGKDVITDYTADEDSIVINDGYVSTSSVKGSDVIFKVGKGTLTVKNGKSKELTVIDKLGTHTRVYDNDMFITDSDKAKVKAKSKIITIDASSRTKNIYINGNSKSNTLIGGSGNDTMTGGAGKDIFYYESGNDIITDYKASQKDEIVLTNGTIDLVSVKGSNVIFNIGDGTLTVKGGKSQTITITDAEGNKTSQKYTKSSSFIEESDADSGYWFANDDNFETTDIDLMVDTTVSNVITIENNYSLTDKIIDDKLPYNHSAVTYKNNKLD